MNEHVNLAHEPTFSNHEFSNVDPFGAQRNGERETVEAGPVLVHVDERFVHVAKNHQHNDEIRNLERLVRLHFLMRNDTVDFILSLDKSLQRLRIKTKKVTYVVQGQVHGKIDLPKTIRIRNISNPVDYSTFVIERIVKNYEIPENLILKSFLSILHSIIIEDYLPILYRKHPDPSLQKLISHNKLNTRLIKSFLENIHIRRIGPIDQDRITNKMIKLGMKSRHRLYRDTTMLYRSYQNLFVDIHELYEDSHSIKRGMKAISAASIVIPTFHTPSGDQVAIPMVNEATQDLEPDSILGFINGNKESDRVFKGHEEREELDEREHLESLRKVRELKRAQGKIEDDGKDEVPEAIEITPQRAEMMEVPKSLEGEGPERNDPMEEPPIIPQDEPNMSIESKFIFELESIRTALNENWWDPQSIFINDDVKVELSGTEKA